MLRRTQAATQSVLVLLLRGGRLQPAAVAPSEGVELGWCDSLDELERRAARERPLCVVADLAADESAVATVRRVRHVVGSQTVIAAFAAGAGDVDLVLDGVATVQEEVGGAIRLARGQTAPSWHRARVSGRVTIEAEGRQYISQLLDLSEGGVAIAAVEELPTDRPLRLRLQLEDDRHLSGEAVFARRTSADDRSAIAFRWTAMDERDRAVLRLAVARAQPHVEPAVARTGAPAPHIIGASATFKRAMWMLDRVADTEATVLLLGESGTGKELAARYLHQRSRRAQRRFVGVNCAALPEQLLESELFGHEAGAFTGAMRRRIGRFEQASGGTLFLDEVGDLPAMAQAKLLRALQERAIERVGGGQLVPIDIRLIAATNQDIGGEASAQSFRRDLFFRLNVVMVMLPPLRERREDIPTLAEHFIGAALRRMNKHGVRLSEHALRSMVEYSWPGNVRELENVCTRVVALASDGEVIGPEDLVLFARDPLVGCKLPSTDLREVLDFCEREIVRRMLDRNGGNRTRTAVDLGISRQALQQKLSRFRNGRGGDDDPKAE